MLRVIHYEHPGRRSRRLVLRHLLDTSEAARRVGHHSIAQVRLSCVVSSSVGQLVFLFSHVSPLNQQLVAI